MPSKIEKLHYFEAYLDNIFGYFQDDTSKIMIDGKFPGNYEDPDDDIIWHSIPENSPNNNKEIPEEKLDQYMI